MESLRINGTPVPPGSRVTLELPVTRLYTHTELSIPVHVVNGPKPGPVLFVSAAIHGDEINGVEIIRRLLAQLRTEDLRGALIAMPVVNVHGFLQRSRYLPDRRDLNRSFPGSSRGSLAARVAHRVMQTIVAKASHGIDLHTAATHRVNLPQIRADLSHEPTRRLAESFGAPVLINADMPDGSLRQAAGDKGLPVLLYEGGEGMRLDEEAITTGVSGICRVMGSLEMLREKVHVAAPITALASQWVRAPESGLFLPSVRLGHALEKGASLGIIAHPFDAAETALRAPFDAVVIGMSRLPLVHEGEALVHLARVDDVAVAASRIAKFRDAAAV
jgi:predicted deacylase